jgi:hypothetical protein
MVSHKSSPCTSTSSATTAKFWLDPIELERSHGFRRQEINRIRHLVEKHQWHFLEAWNEFFHG